MVPWTHLLCLALTIKEIRHKSRGGGTKGKNLEFEIVLFKPVLKDELFQTLALLKVDQI